MKNKPFIAGVMSLFISLALSSGVRADYCYTGGVYDVMPGSNSLICQCGGYYTTSPSGVSEVAISLPIKNCSGTPDCGDICAKAGYIAGILSETDSITCEEIAGPLKNTMAAKVQKRVCQESGSTLLVTQPVRKL